MGHARRMQHNRRRQIHEMIKREKMILEEPEMTLTKGFLMSENMKEYLKGKVKVPRD